MRVFVTVGATSTFDLLVETVLSHAVLQTLSQKGFNHLVIQCGSSSRFLECHESRDNMSIVIWKLRDSLKDELRASHLVISHAGSGSILDALRLCKPLIVVPNPTLLDNHQLELAEALETRGHLKSSEIPNLASTITQFDASALVPFPEFDGAKFRSILDQEMGFAA